LQAISKLENRFIAEFDKITVEMGTTLLEYHERFTSAENDGVYVEV